MLLCVSETQRETFREDKERVINRNAATLRTHRICLVGVFDSNSRYLLPPLPYALKWEKKVKCGMLSLMVLFQAMKIRFHPFETLENLMHSSNVIVETSVMCAMRH